MKTSSAKAKGRRACLEVADIMRQKAKDLATDDILVTPSGVPGDDIRLSPLAQTIYPWNIEVKNVEKLNIWDALAQVESRKQDNKFTVLFFKRNRSKTYACVEFDYLIQLANELAELKKEVKCLKLLS